MSPTPAIGVDLIEVGRVARVMERHPERFLSRHFTAGEQADAQGHPERLAARFAAKEAAAKALGSGIGPVGWHEVEVRTDPAGAPQLFLHGQASALAARRGHRAWSISLSHTREHAVAAVIFL